MDAKKTLLQILSSFFPGKPGRASEMSQISDSDWKAVTDLAFRNRMLPLVYRYLKTANKLEGLSSPISEKAQNSFKKTLANVILYEQEIHRIFKSFEKAKIPVILMRGLYVAEKVYPAIGTRPFSDIDILVTKENVSRSALLLKQLGYCLPYGTLPEKYYMRNHLHVWYVRKAANSSCELHWNIDHEYTDYLINVPGIFSKASLVELAGMKMLAMDIYDRLLSLAIHYQKHCNYVKYFWDHVSFQNVLTNRGDLIYAVDLYYFYMKNRDVFDAQTLAKRAEEWNVSELAYTTLATVKDLFSCEELASLLSSIKKRPVSFFEKQLAYIFFPEFNPRKGQLKRAKGFSMKMFFGISRLLDLWPYLFPGKSYLIRRYSLKHVWVVLPFLHVCVVVSELSVNVFDFLKYTLLSKRRKSKGL